MKTLTTEMVATGTDLPKTEEAKTVMIIENLSLMGYGISILQNDKLILAVTSHMIDDDVRATVEQATFVTIGLIKGFNVDTIITEEANGVRTELSFNQDLVSKTFIRCRDVGGYEEAKNELEMRGGGSTLDLYYEMEMTFDY